MFTIPDSWYRIKKIPKKGRGAFALRDIEAGTVIGDYLGILVPRDGSDEGKNGLYDMAGGLNYEILADPKRKGIHLINHSCANNCDAYPYQGHILYIALRKIFRGEELTVTYSLYAPEESTPCRVHACYCGSKFCTGTMHEAWHSFDEWHALVKKNFGKWYKRLPGNYGDQLPPLAHYPKTIVVNHPNIYNVFASEKKPAVRYADKKLPAIADLRQRITTTGQRAAFPKFGITIDGIKNTILLAEQNRS